MANYQAIVSIGLQDWLGVEVPLDSFVTVADTTTVAQIVAWTQGWCALIDPVTDAMGVQCHFKLQFPSTGLKTAPTSPGSPVEQTLLSNYKQNGSIYKAPLDLPSIAQAKIVNGKVSPTDTNVAAFTGYLLALTTGIQGVGKFGNILQAVVDNSITFRKHRKSENKKSTTVIG